MYKKNLKKNDIAKNLSFKTGLSENYSKKIVNDLFEILSNHLKSKNLNIKNLGSFKILYKKERIGRNPKTKEEYIINARKVISFTISQNLSKKIKDLF
mgnify:CR=1 FL=1